MPENEPSAVQRLKNCQVRITKTSDILKLLVDSLSLGEGYQEAVADELHMEFLRINIELEESITQIEQTLSRLIS